MQKREFNAGEQHLRAAIAGFDMEGRATYEYLSLRPGVDITVLDERDVDVPSGVTKITGPDVFSSKLDFDQVWRTPGLSPFKLQTDGEVTSGTIAFFNLCPAPIIGVTGTKGKGTTASLIAAILEESKKTVHLVGNIGQPALSVLPDIKPEDIVVFELSSFQLWDIKSSPQVAVVLMIEPDHLDVHKDLADYLQAKSNIARWQGPDDKVIYLSE
ncbi:MAG TPA: Mur ligase family protein, partial [Candidatus Saccharimonadales bacterium]